MKKETKGKTKLLTQPKFKFGEMVFFLYEDSIKQGLVKEISFRGDIEDINNNKDLVYLYTILHRKCSDSRIDSFSVNENEIGLTLDEVKSSISVNLHCKEP